MVGMYSIKDLEKLSGIKAHTIRIWEKRHGIVKPKRTSTNIRYYSDEDLKKILNIALLSTHGLKISAIAELNDDDIREKINALTSGDSDYEVQINHLIISMVDMNEAQFDKVFNTSVLRIGFEDTITKLIYPFLRKVGIMWGVGDINPAQEHFMSNLIRQKIIVAIDGLMVKQETDSEYVLFLKEDELHELGLLMSNYFIRKRNKSTLYLGQNVPLKDLIEVVQAKNPKYLITSFITSLPTIDLQQYLEKLTKTFPHQEILVFGENEMLNKLDFPTHARHLTSPPSLLSFIETH